MQNALFGVGVIFVIRSKMLDSCIGVLLAHDYELKNTCHFKRENMILILMQLRHSQDFA